jgi:flagellar basal-body rod protein FlgG
MMRALWTAASGMTAQQLNVDVIANNLANVNTTGYKKERVEFKDLLYQTIDRARVLNNGGKPVNLQVGHGTAYVATVKDFSTGSPDQTDNPLDFFIDGEGFFMVQGPDGDTYYTRDGSFKISITEDGNMLTTSEGYPVLDDTGEPIYIDYDISDMVFSENGEISYTDEDGLITPTGQTIGLAYFTNRNGLESKGNNLHKATQASGEAIMALDTDKTSLIKQNYLESSNVKTVEEMVKLIVSQRAYELNSKAIQSSDEMLSIANNLVR